MCLCVKLELNNCRKLLFNFCKARSVKNYTQSIETHANCFSAEFSNLAQAHMTCRVLCFALSIKGKTLATFLGHWYAVCVNLLWDLEVFTFIHTQGYQDQDWCWKLGNLFSCCFKSLKKNTSGSTCGCCGSRKEIVHGLGVVTWSW